MEEDAEVAEMKALWSHHVQVASRACSRCSPIPHRHSKSPSSPFPPPNSINQNEVPFEKKVTIRVFVFYLISVISFLSNNTILKLFRTLIYNSKIQFMNTENSRTSNIQNFSSNVFVKF